jgi:uncharacterized ion transporter superfamily protein YfcC
MLLLLLLLLLLMMMMICISHVTLTWHVPAGQFHRRGPCGC